MSRREDGWRSQVALFGENSLNALDRWRMNNARDEEERAQQRQQERNEVEALRVEMGGELTRLRDEIEQQREMQIEVVGTALGEYGDKILDRAEQFTREIQRELFTLVEKRFAELAGRLDAVLPDARSRSTKDFKFASERNESDVIDLPNPLVRKTTLN